MELLKLCSDKDSDITRIKHLLNEPAVDPNFYDEVSFLSISVGLLFKKLAV